MVLSRMRLAICCLLLKLLHIDKTTEYKDLIRFQRMNHRNFTSDFFPSRRITKRLKTQTFIYNFK